MEEKIKEIVEMKQRSLAEENQKTLEVLKERYHHLCWNCISSEREKIQHFCNEHQENRNYDMYKEYWLLAWCVQKIIINLQRIGSRGIHSCSRFLTEGIIKLLEEKKMHFPPKASCVICNIPRQPRTNLCLAFRHLFWAKPRVY